MLLVPTVPGLFTKAVGGAVCIMVATEVIYEAGRWLRSLFPYSETDRKTGEAAGRVFWNATKPLGLFDAFRKCPWPTSLEGLGCYAEGIANGPIGRFVTYISAPVRIGMNTAYCFSSEEGIWNKIGCSAGLDDEGKLTLEEKTEIAAIFVLLFAVWYGTLPEDEQRKKAFMKRPQGRIEH